MTNYLFRGVLLLICLTVTTDAFAAGFYLPGHGIKPLGRAGAFVASGEGDLNSIWYNPANLAPMGEFNLLIDVAAINLSFDHTRAPRTLENGETRTYETISNEAAPKIDPQIIVGGPTPIDGLTWSFGLYAPYLSGHTFPEDGAQRYVLVDNDASLAGFMHLALAYEISDNFRVGLGFQNVPANFKLVTTASGYTGLFGDAEDRDLDILSEIQLTSLFTPSGNGGAWVRISENFAAAVSFQLPVVFSDDNATLTARLPSHPEFQNAKLVGDSLSSKLSFPMIIRGGVMLENEALTLELAAVWEGWSILDKLEAKPNGVRVEDLPGIGTLPVGPLDIPTEWQDTISVRLGGEYRFGDDWAITGGYAFETGAIPDERYSVFLADGDKHLFGLGGNYTVGPVTIDASMGYYLIPSRNITNSKWRQLNPSDADGDVTLVVGNGLYEQNYLAGGLGTSVAF